MQAHMNTGYSQIRIRASKYLSTRANNSPRLEGGSKTDAMCGTWDSGKPHRRGTCGSPSDSVATTGLRLASQPNPQRTQGLSDCAINQTHFIDSMVE